MISLLDKGDFNGLDRGLCFSNRTQPLASIGSGDNETNVSTQQDQASPHARLQGQDADQRRNPSDTAKARQGTKAIVRVTPETRPAIPVEECSNPDGLLFVSKNAKNTEAKGFCQSKSLRQEGPHGTFCDHGGSERAGHEQAGDHGEQASRKRCPEEPNQAARPGILPTEHKPPPARGRSGRRSQERGRGPGSPEGARGTGCDPFR